MILLLIFSLIMTMKFNKSVSPSDFICLVRISFPVAPKSYQLHPYLVPLYINCMCHAILRSSIFTLVTVILSFFMYWLYLTYRITLCSSSKFKLLTLNLALLCSNYIWHARLALWVALYSHWLQSYLAFSCTNGMRHIRLPCIASLHSHWLH